MIQRLWESFVTWLKGLPWLKMLAGGLVLTLFVALLSRDGFTWLEWVGLYAFAAVVVATFDRK